MNEIDLEFCDDLYSRRTHVPRFTTSCASYGLKGCPKTCYYAREITNRAVSENNGENKLGLGVKNE